MVKNSGFGQNGQKYISEYFLIRIFWIGRDPPPFLPKVKKQVFFTPPLTPLVCFMQQQNFVFLYPTENDNFHNRSWAIKKLWFVCTGKFYELLTSYFFQFSNKNGSIAIGVLLLAGYIWTWTDRDAFLDCYNGIQGWLLIAHQKGKTGIHF